MQFHDRFEELDRSFLEKSTSSLGLLGVLIFFDLLRQVPVGL